MNADKGKTEKLDTKEREEEHEGHEEKACSNCIWKP